MIIGETIGNSCLFWEKDSRCTKGARCHIYRFNVDIDRSRCFYSSENVSKDILKDLLA